MPNIACREAVAAVALELLDTHKMSTRSNIEELKALRWATGKEAVGVIKDIAFGEGKSVFVANRGGTLRRINCSSNVSGCNWSVTLAQFRNKGGPNDWHVTNAQLENCTSSSKPSRKQLVNHPVVRAAIAAMPTVSTRSSATQLRHQSGVAASQHIVYRAKETIKSQMFAQDPTTVRLLPSFLSELERLNTGITTDFECYRTGHFRRALIVMNPHWFVHGQGVFGIDSAHMKHWKYNGVQIVLVGRDSNLSNQIAAVGLAPVEDHIYLWVNCKM